MRTEDGRLGELGDAEAPKTAREFVDDNGGLINIFLH